MTDYLTRDGDMIDAIVAAHYGVDSGFAVLLATVLDLNPHLAGFGPTLSAGVTVHLPARPARPTRTTVRLWGAA